MNNPAIVVFTFKSVQQLIAEGGSSSWNLSRRNAISYKYVVCTRNRNSPYSDDTETPHQAAFLVGKIRDIVPSLDHQDRWLITFSEYALISKESVWKGRNPVAYSSLEDLGIDISMLQFQPMPQSTNLVRETPEPSHEKDKSPALTIATAKIGLALTYGVTPEQIEITIRG